MELGWGQLDFGPTLLDIETETAEVASSVRFWNLGTTRIIAVQNEKTGGVPSAVPNRSRIGGAIGKPLDQ